MEDPICALFEAYEAIRRENSYAYFELARSRVTGWMAWVCDKCPDADSGRPLPDRIVLASGQGDTPHDACAEALAMLRKGGLA